MKIVLVEDVPKVGGAGDITTVADGYARNYLIPRGLAVLATLEEVNRAESRRKAAAQRHQKYYADMSQLAQFLDGQAVTLRARVGPSGRLYGSVTSQAIAEAVAELAGREFDHRVVELETPLRELGEHPVLLRLGPEIVATVNVLVEAEGGLPAAALAKAAAAESEAEAEAEEAVAESEAAAGDEPAQEDGEDEAFEEESR